MSKRTRSALLAKAASTALEKWGNDLNLSAFFLEQAAHKDEELRDALVAETIERLCREVSAESPQFSRDEIAKEVLRRLQQSSSIGN
jgi:hypothetical protein